MSRYEPQPIDTSTVVLNEELLLLVEQLAAHTHDVWAQQRMADGWQWGEARCDVEKKHPCLVPYDSLPDSEKEYDRVASVGVLKAVVALGYRIVR